MKKAALSGGVEDSLFFLTQKWKELEEYFESAQESLGKRFAEVDFKENQLDSAQKSINERLSELDLKEKQLDSMRLSVDEGARHLVLVQKSVEKRIEEVESKEKRLDLERFSLEEKRNGFEATRDNVNDCFKELELKQKKLDLVEKVNEECNKQLNSKLLAAEGRLGDFQLKLKAVGERHELIESKLEEFVEQSRVLQLKVEELDQLEEFLHDFSRRLRTEHEEFEQHVEERYLKEEELERREKEFEEHIREVEEKFQREKEDFKRFHLKEKELEKRSKKHELREKECEERSKRLELKEKEIEDRTRELDKYIQSRTKDLELREKLFHSGGNTHEGRPKLMGEIEKQHANVLNATVKFEQEEYVLDNKETNSSTPDLEFRVKMDGMALQLYLNEHSDKHEMMRDEVHAALGMSSDPAKLVLDAMQGFYPPYKEGVKEFEVSVIRRSCCLLLGQLLRMSPKIRPCVKEEATKLSFDWKAKMEAACENSLEILGFLLLVTAFRLVSAFDEDELFRLFQLVAQHRDAPELFRALGFPDGRSISDFIQNLLKRRQNLAAIRFIHAFELVADFPPVPILEDYCKYWKKFADETFQIEGYLSETQINLAKKCMAAFKAVIRCIDDHKLQTECLPETLGKCIEKLKKKASSMCPQPVSASRVEQEQQKEKKATALPAETNVVLEKQSKSKPLQTKSLGDMPSATTSMDKQDQPTWKSTPAPVVSNTRAELEKQITNKRPKTESMGTSSSTSLASGAEKKQRKTSPAGATRNDSIAELEKLRKRKVPKNQVIDNYIHFSHQKAPWQHEAVFVDEESPYFVPRYHPFYGLAPSHPVDRHISMKFSPFISMDGPHPIDSHMDTFWDSGSGIDSLPFGRPAGEPPNIFDGPFPFSAYDSPPPFRRPFYTYDHSAR